jgi:poly(3-hydroxybutyrate) depolymerase
MCWRRILVGAVLLSVVSSSARGALVGPGSPGDPGILPGTWTKVRKIDVPALREDAGTAGGLDPDSNGVHEREYRIYVPAGCGPSIAGRPPCPMVILLHSAGHTGHGFATNAGAGTPWTTAADLYGLVMAAPNAEFEGNGRSDWSNGLFMGLNRIDHVDEVGFLNRMVEAIQTSGVGNVDPDAQGVWLHGGSSGGFLTHSLAGVFNPAFAYRIRGIATSVSSYGGHEEHPHFDQRGAPDPNHNYAYGTLCFQERTWKRQFDLLNPAPTYPIPAIVTMGKFDQEVPDQGDSDGGCYQPSCHDDGDASDCEPPGCSKWELRYTRDLAENALHYAVIPGLNDCSGPRDTETDSGEQKEVVTYRRDANGTEHGGRDPSGQPSGCKAVVQRVLLSCGLPSSPCPSGQRWAHNTWPKTGRLRLVWDTTHRIVEFWQTYAGLTVRTPFGVAAHVHVADEVASSDLPMEDGFSEEPAIEEPDVAAKAPVIAPEPAAEDLPQVLELLAPRPNPMLGSVLFAFRLPESERVRVEVFDVAGRRVARVGSHDTLPPGLHSLAWNGRSDSGVRLEAGVYLVRVSAGARSMTRRFVMMSP